MKETEVNEMAGAKYLASVLSAQTAMSEPAEGILSTLLTSSTSKQSDEQSSPATSQSRMKRSRDLNDTQLSEDSEGKRLVLVSKELIVVPPQVFTLTATLQVLDLSRNKLELLPPAIGELTVLTALNLSRNKLRELPCEISNLTELVTLDLLSNNLNKNTLPLQELSTLRNLRLLDLQYNRKCNKGLLELTAAAGGIFKGGSSGGVEVRLTSTAAKGAPDEAIVGAHACNRDATLLRSQLEPWSTPTLRRRLLEHFKVATDPETENRAVVMEKLLASYAQEGPRNIKRLTGSMLCRQELYNKLMVELDAWVKGAEGTPRERPTIAATSYMILRSPAEFSKQDGQKAKVAAAKLGRHQKLWDLAAAVIEEADAHHAKIYTAVAFTHNFVGSPHIDTQNVGPFVALGLGDYVGGELCVESGVSEVSQCDTKGKLVKVDGRFPHWVAPYQEGGTRYSIIYYQTLGDCAPQGQAVLL